MMSSERLRAWFDHTRDVLQSAYTAAAEPWKQSGMSGPFERWTALRRPVADCMERDGSFLDIGCANGYLLECALLWTAERGITIEPYGIDISASLIAMARERHPAHADRFTVANAFEWIPPRRFDYVRTELVYVPAEFERRYIDHLLDNYIAPGGRLLIANYAEGVADPARGLLPGSHPTRYLRERLEELGVPVAEYRYGVDPEGRSGTCVAVVDPLAVPG